MRNPNGYGCVYKLSGNRRKPFCARVTDRWEYDEATGRSRQIFVNLGTFATRPEAFAALAAYHADPHAIPSAATFAEIYEKWSREKFEKISYSGVKGYEAAYKYCAALYKLRFVDIRKAHMQHVLDHVGAGWHTKKNVKVLFNQLYRYAVENDFVAKDYSAFVELGANPDETERKPFTRAEIDRLWENVDRLEWVDTVLILIYSGWRIGELLKMRTENVDLESWTFLSGSKTDSGKNRVVPIHTRIRPLVSAYYDSSRAYLLPAPAGDAPLSYYTYRDVYFRNVMTQLEMEHTPHECRHTFASLMDSAGANKLSIKRIMGHKAKDITDQVYTHKEIDELRAAIELIK